MQPSTTNLAHCFPRTKLATRDLTKNKNKKIRLNQNAQMIYQTHHFGRTLFERVDTNIMKSHFGIEQKTKQTQKRRSSKADD